MDSEPNNPNVPLILEREKALKGLTNRNGDYLKAIEKEFELMAQFEGLYPGEDYTSKAITTDINYVVTRANYFFRDNQGENVGDELESLFVTKAGLSGWFGEGASLIKTLRYDDYANKVDAVLVFRCGIDDENRVAIMVDCTSNPEKIGDKILGNKNMIANNGGRVVKYHQNDNSGFSEKFSLTCIPFVVGVDLDRVQDLTTNIKNDEYLKSSPAQIAFLLEMKSQADMYRRFLSSHPIKYQDPESLETELGIVSRLFDRLLREKSDLLSRDSTQDYLHHDLTYGLIDSFSFG